MQAFPALKPIKKEVFSLTEFCGLDKREGANVKSLPDMKNMSASGYPALCTRKGRKKVFTVPSTERIMGIYPYSKVYLCTAFSGGIKIYSGNSLDELACVYTSSQSEEETSVICRFDNKLSVFNLKKALDVPSLLTASDTTFDFPTMSIAPNFTDVTVFKGRVFGCRLRQIRACEYGNIRCWTEDSDAPIRPAQNKPFLKNFEVNGNFTACTTYKNKAIFFTSDEMYELYGSDPDSFEIIKIANVGCLNKNALCEINGVLYFVSKDGVMRYSGNFPECFSSRICETANYSIVSNDRNYDVCLGGCKEKLYVKYADANGCRFYSFDTQNEHWASEDDFSPVCIESYDGKAYAATSQAVYMLDADMSLYPENNDGNDFDWEFTTHDIQSADIRKKRSSKICLRISQPVNSKISIYASFDGGDFSLLSVALIYKTKSICLPIYNRDYDSIRLKICGKGQAKIDYLSREYSCGGQNYEQNTY